MKTGSKGIIIFFALHLGIVLLLMMFSGIKKLRRLRSFKK